MKKQKMSFMDIKDVLSRDEMKEIMAGSGSTSSCGICLAFGGYDQGQSCVVRGYGCKCPISDSSNCSR